MKHFGFFKREQALALVLVVLSILATSCTAAQMPVNYVAPVAEQVVQIGSGSVAFGIQQALMDAAGTYILRNGDKLLFVWSYPQMKAEGFFAIDMAGKNLYDAAKIIRDGGQLASAQTVADLVKSLQNNGWKVVTGASLSTELFWTTAAATCEAFVRMPIVFIYMTDTGAGDFLNWFETLYPKLKT